MTLAIQSLADEIVPAYVAVPVAATTWYPLTNWSLKDPCAWLTCARLVHGDDGPVMVGGPEAVLVVKPHPIHSSDACTVVGVAPEDQLVAPVPTVPAVWSNGVTGYRPDHSYTDAMSASVPVPPAAVMTTEVCPPTQLRSSQAAPMAASEPEPNVESWLKLSADPPMVMLVMDVGFEVVPEAARMTISALPATVGESSVIVSEPRAAEPCLVWTRATAHLRSGQRATP